MSAKEPGRIVVALRPGTPSEVALEIARYLPISAAELLGLFVEDARLLAHAASSLAREVVLSGGARPLERASLERELRAQAAEQRRRFEAAAGRLGLRHAFRIARGEPLEELLQGAAGAEALVVAAGGFGLQTWTREALHALAHAPLPSVLFARETWSTGTGIVAYLEDEDGPLRVAARLATATRSTLTLLVPAASAAIATARLTERVLAEGLGAPRVLPIGALSAAALQRAARHARLLVLPSVRAEQDDALIDAVLETLRAPLLLVR
jgi:hypothetical protein